MTEDVRYHHGNLREALIEAGLKLLEKRGSEGVTLRATARAAGVSHSAPYHHFSDKAHLIEALAARGFERFTQRLVSARKSTPGNPLARLQATGIAYVTFAVENKALFRLMNRPELRRRARESHKGDGSVESLAHGSFAVLIDGIRECQQAGLVDGEDPRPYALTAWSLVHGLAVLTIDDLIQKNLPGENEPVEFARTVTGVLGRGLLTRG